MIKVVVALLVATTVAAFAAVIFSLDAVSRASAADQPTQTAAEHMPVTAGVQEDAATSGTAAPVSYAGVKPANADELAKAHTPYDAKLPPVQPGPVAVVKMTVKDMVVEIAPGVKYTTWAFDGKGAPGPIIHVKQGQRVEFEIVNGGSIPHSMDFHAARIAPNEAFTDVMPGESFKFEFVANDPGVFKYHCGTKPVLAHIANGMYGAIVVDPITPLPKVDNEYVLVGSEWYMDGDGIAKPAGLDMNKARVMQPDWMTFNGYAGQYVQHPLTAKPGETTRFYVVGGGPTLDVNFHVVGTVFDRAWVNGDVTNPPQKGVQTVIVPAGGGGIFDVKIPDEGTYPFVSHAFAHVELGQVGLLKVGNPDGTMSH